MNELMTLAQYSAPKCSAPGCEKQAQYAHAELKISLSRALCNIKACCQKRMRSPLLRSRPTYYTPCAVNHLVSKKTFLNDTTLPVWFHQLLQRGNGFEGLAVSEHHFKIITIDARPIYYSPRPVNLLLSRERIPKVGHAGRVPSAEV